MRSKVQAHRDVTDTPAFYLICKYPTNLLDASYRWELHRERKVIIGGKSVARFLINRTRQYQIRDLIFVGSHARNSSTFPLERIYPTSPLRLLSYVPFLNFPQRSPHILLPSPINHAQSPRTKVGAQNSIEPPTTLPAYK